MTRKKGWFLFGAVVLAAALFVGILFGWKAFQRSQAVKAAGIWQADGHWGESLKNSGDLKSAEKLADKILEVRTKYLSADNRVFCALIPDKGYYLQSQGAPKVDYDAFFETVKTELSNSDVQFIDLTGSLSAEQYFTTDSHWRQEALQPVLDTLGNAMDFTISLEGFTPHSMELFAGAYHKYGAKPNDTLVYLTSNATDAATVQNFQHPEVAAVYDLDRLSTDVPYDVFLSGATPLVTITSPNARTDRELVIFRDSFSSSLAPLLLEEYCKITLVDLRYMASTLLPQHLEFTNQDVLFLYSTLVADQRGLLH